MGERTLFGASEDLRRRVEASGKKLVAAQERIARICGGSPAAAPPIVYRVALTTVMPLP